MERKGKIYQYVNDPEKFDAEMLDINIDKLKDNFKALYSDARKKEALHKLADLEKDVAELRKILEIPEKKSKRERVRCNKIYFIISAEGSIEGYQETYSKINDVHYNRFNYFYTEEEAEKALELQKIENKLLLLIEKINQEDDCPDNFPDWEDGSQYKHSIYFVHDFGRILKDCCLSSQFNKNYFYCYREFLDDAIEEIGKENLEKYFKNY